MRIDKHLSIKLANMSFLCSLLIVCIHVGVDVAPNTLGWWGMQYMSGNGIPGIAVPFFFVASGFFLVGHVEESGWWWHAIRKRLSSLGIPYVFWNLFYWGFAMALSYALSRFGIAWGDERTRTFDFVRCAEALGFNPFQTPELPFLWYVRMLLMLVLLSPIFVWFVKRTRAWGLVFLFCLFFLSRFILHTTPKWGMVNSWFFPLRGVFYFSLGVYCRLFPQTWKLTKAACCIISVAALFLYGGGIGLSEYAEGVVGGEVLKWLAIPVLLCGIWGLVPCAPWPQALVSLSFPLFLLHSMMVTFIMAGFRILGLKDFALHSVWAFPLKLLLVGTGSLVLAHSLKRIVPRFSSLVFGGR